jgi:hypothetical protein
MQARPLRLLVQRAWAPLNMPSMFMFIPMSLFSPFHTLFELHVHVHAGKALEAAGAKSLGALILEHLDGLKAAG